MAEIPPPPPGFKLDAPTGSVPPPPPGFTLDAPQQEAPSEPGMLETPKQFAIGAGTGYALGIPEAVVGGVNWLDKTARHLMGQTDVKPALDPSYYSPISAVQNLLFDKPPEGYEGARDAGNLVGMVAGGRYGAPRVPAALPPSVGAAVRGAGSEAAALGTTSAGIAAGSQAAPAIVGAVGNAIGGDYGQRIGEDIGEGVGPAFGASTIPLVRNFGQRLVRTALTDANTPNISQAAANIGVPNSFGLSGNGLARWLEDITTTPQMGGGPARETRLAQHQAMGNAATTAAEALRGNDTRSQAPVDVETVGNSVLRAAQKANRGYENSQRFVQDTLENRIGERTPVDVSPIIQHVRGDEGLRAGGEFGPVPAEVPAEQIPMMQRYWESSRKRDTLPPVIEQLERDRVAPFDPALDAELRRNLASARNAMTDTIEGQPITGRYPRNWAPDPVTGESQGRGYGRRAAIGADPLARGRLASVVDDTERAIQDNTGVAYGALKDWRTDLGRAMEGREALHPDYEVELYKRATDAMRNTAVEQGVSGDRFDALQRLTRGFHKTENNAEGPLPMVKRVSELAEPKDAYTAAFGGAIPSVTLLDAMSRRARPETEAAMADWMQQKIRGNTDIDQTVPDPSANPTGAFNRVRADNFMQGLSEGMKQRLSGSTPETIAENRQRLDDMATVYQAERARPTRSLPQGGTSITAPGIFTALPMVGLAADTIANGVFRAGAPIGLANRVGAYLTNPLNVDRAMREPTPWMDSLRQGVSNAAPAVIPRPQDEQQ